MNSIEVTRSVKEMDEVVKDFMKNRSNQDLPPLSDAIKQNRLDIGQALIDRNVDVNEYSIKPGADVGMAPIHFVKSPEAVRMLAAAGATIDAPYQEVNRPAAMAGETKLQNLALSGQVNDLPTISALLDAGANEKRGFSHVEYQYDKNSDVAPNDRVVRHTHGMPARLDVIRENSNPKIEVQLLTKGKDDNGYIVVAEGLDFQKIMKDASKIQASGIDIIVTEKDNHSVLHARSNLYDNPQIGNAIQGKSTPEGAYWKGRGEIVERDFYDKLPVDYQSFQNRQQSPKADVSLQHDKETARTSMGADDKSPATIDRTSVPSEPGLSKGAGDKSPATIDTTSVPSEPGLGKGAGDKSPATIDTTSVPSEPGLGKQVANSTKGAGDMLSADIEAKTMASAAEQPKAVSTSDKQDLITDGAASVDEKGRKIILTKKDYPLPENILGTYNVKNGKFLDKATDALRFEDHGKKLSTPVEDRAVIADMIAVADVKNWGSLELKGTDNFKQIAWLEASARGIETKGYKPTERDLENLDLLKRERGITTENPAVAGATEKTNNSVEVVIGRERGAPDIATDQPSPQTAAAVKAVQKPDAPVTAAPEPVHDTVRDDHKTGKLLEHGPAKYQFNPKENDSYYVKLETTTGEKVIWGKDLERAISDAAVKPGDTVNLSRKGSEDVVVNRNMIDEKGQIVGNEKIDAIRNKWEVKPVELKVERAMSPDEQLKVDGAAKVLSKALAKYPEKDRDQIIARLTEGINNGTVNLKQFPAPKVSVRSVDKPVPEQERDRGVKEQARSR